MRIDAVGFPSLDHPPIVGAPHAEAGRGQRAPGVVDRTRRAAGARRGARDRRGDDDAEPTTSTIGDVVLSASLWRILADEAEQHLATLEHELSLLQFDPQHVPSAAMVRASHTLCGIHRTGGFPLIAAQAKALELTLIALAAARRADAGGRAAGARTRDGGPALARRRACSGATPFHAGDEVEAQRDRRRARRLAPRGDDRRGASMPRRPPREQAARDEETARSAADRAETRAPTPRRRRRASPLDAAASMRRQPRRRRAGVELALPAPPADPLAGVRDEIEDETGAADLPRGSGRALPAGRRGSCAPGAARRDDRAPRSSCGARCTRSRAARGWPARCGWASSRT